MGRHVMLIEDEPNISEAIRFILSRDGWDVSCHAEGSGAVARMQDVVPDVVILDLMLPGQGGFEILGAMRADPALSETPVLMLTAKGQDRDREASVRAGADMFMAKPFSNAEILAAVRNLASGRHPR